MIHNIILEELNKVINNREYYNEDKYEISKKYHSGYATIFDLDNGKSNFIDDNGNILSSQWFDDVDSFDDNVGTAIVNSNGKYNYITTEGDYLLSVWVDDAYDFDMLFGDNGKLIGYYAEIVYHGRSYYIDQNGNEIKMGNN